jgi:kinetochore protein Spc7/SPC105
MSLSNYFLAKVEALEKAHGWTITGISGTITSMTYLKEIELVFDPSSFLPNNADIPTKPPVNTRIDLWYIGAVREHNPEPLTPEKEFFLQCIRDHIRGLPQAETPIKDLLRAVSVSWHKAKAVTDDIRLLKHCGITETAKTSDDSIKITTNLVIKPVATKVEIPFHLTCQSGETGIDVQIEPGAKVIYGERFKEPSMGDFLLNRCGDSVEEKNHKTKMSWGDAIAELEKKLIARGRK